MLGYYLELGFVILEHRANNLSSVPHEAKTIMCAINIHKSEFLMDCYTEIPSVANTKNKLLIIYDLHSVYIHNFYHDKQDITD